MTGSQPIRYVDPAAAGEFVATCDRAIEEVRKLETNWRAAGDESGASLADRMASYISGWREAALKGTLHASEKGNTHLGVTRFASEYFWGPEGDAFLDAARELEEIWGKLGS